MSFRDKSLGGRVEEGSVWASLILKPTCSQWFQAMGSPGDLLLFMRSVALRCENHVELVGNSGLRPHPRPTE